MPPTPGTRAVAYPSYAGYAPTVIGPRLAQSHPATIRSGVLGSLDTLGNMKEAVRRSLRDPRVLEAGAMIVRPAMPRDRDTQAMLLRGWLARHLRFLNDPPSVELVRSPEYLLDRIGRDGVAQGDCDDMAVLGAALAMAAGMRARFVAVGFRGPRGPLSHVFTEVLANTGWKELDVSKEPGRPVPVASRTIIREV